MPHMRSPPLLGALELGVRPQNQCRRRRAGVACRCESGVDSQDCHRHRAAPWCYPPNRLLLHGPTLTSGPVRLLIRPSEKAMKTVAPRVVFQAWLLSLARMPEARPGCCCVRLMGFPGRAVAPMPGAPVSPTTPRVGGVGRPQVLARARRATVNSHGGGSGETTGISPG